MVVPLIAAAVLRRPGRPDLGEDARTEQVTGPGEGVGDVRMQALEAAWARRAADSELERGASVPPDASCRGRATDHPLLVGRPREASGELGIAVDCRGPSLDAAGGFDPGDRSDEMRARQVVRGWEGLTGWVVRLLLGDCRTAEWASDRDTPQGAGRAPELRGDDGTVVHSPIVAAGSTGSWSARGARRGSRAR